MGTKADNPNKGIGSGNSPITLENLKKGKRFAAGDGRAKELGDKGRATQKANAEAKKTMTQVFREQITDEDMRKLFNMLQKRAEAGNVKAFELMVDTLGMKPSHEIEREKLAIERRKLAMTEEAKDKPTAITIEIKGDGDLSD